MTTESDAIASVNHWRGQCLDNFARAERAIITSLAKLSLDGLHEAASHRTRNLSIAVFTGMPKDPDAKRLAAMLKRWGQREKQRNDLVHGCFQIRGDAETWRITNQVREIRKRVILERETPIAKIEADAFLKAIIAERKELEDALKTFASKTA